MIRQLRSLQIALILLPALACLSGPGSTQTLVDGNAADLDDFRTSFRNPASLAFLPNQLVFGSQAYDVGVNPGVFDLNSGYLSYYSPYWRKRFGLNGQFLRTGIFNRTNFGFSYSERPHPSIAVGGRLDLLNQGFDRNSFQSVDPGDPLLSSALSRNYYSITLGILALPTPDLSIGAVAENVNRPNVALSEEDRFLLPVDYDVGIQYRADRLHPSIDLRYEDGAFRYRFRVGVVLMEDVMARLDYQREKIGLEGNVRLYRGLHFDYRYQYPLNELNTFSSGSHSVSFVYDFTKVLAIADLLDVHYTPEPVELNRSPEPIPLKGDFLVLSSTPSLEIWEKNITRHVDDDIPRDFLKRNYPRIFGVDGREPTPDETGTITFSPDTLTDLVGSYSQRYRNSLDSLSAYIMGGKVEGTTIVSPEHELFRAGNIKDVIVGKARVSPEQIIIVRKSSPSAESGVDSAGTEGIDMPFLNRTETRIDLSREEAEFQVIALDQEGYDDPWSLLIQDSGGRAVKEFSGNGRVPDRIAWNWLDEEGNLVKPGWYSYRFRWVDDRGSEVESPAGRLFVKKNKKNIWIELTKKWTKKIPDAQRLEVIMDR